MQRKSLGILNGLSKVRDVFKSDQDADELIDQLIQDRAVLLLDSIVQREVEQFTKQWVYFNSPAANYARGRTVLEFLIRFRTRFLLLDFHPDNFERLWSSIRSEANPSILQFVVELTTHLRMRGIAQREELDELINHLANSFTFIHESDRRLIDTIVNVDDLAVADEQLFDELPSVDDVVNLLTANTWILGLIYCHRFTVEFFEDLNELTFKQTVDAEKVKAKEPAAAAPTAPRDEVA